MRFKNQAIAKLKFLWAGSLTSSIVLSTSLVAPTTAQLPSLPGILPQPIEQQSNNSDSNSQIDTAWIRLDGRRLVQIADTRERLPERVQDVQRQLQNITDNYFRTNSSTLQVQVRRRVLVSKENKLSTAYPVIYVNNQPLLTVTTLDAKVQGEDDPFKLAQTWSQSIEQDLRKAKQERQISYLQRQGGVAIGILLGSVILSWGIQRLHKRWQLQPPPETLTSADDTVTTQLVQTRQKNLQEVRQRLFQLTQGVVWGSGTLIILGLFPYTRLIQMWILILLRIPFTLAIVGLGTYVAIRLSYVLIDQFTTALANNALLTVQDYVRLQLRVATISGVAKSIATLTGVAIGILLALSSVGVNVVPVLAGAGLIGVGVSLASQSLVKDAINGFFIILEDQYAVGDVIDVGNLGGAVENLNLRITQLRDSEGRLITIPNSEIKAVANLSSRWSRADLNIPVAYDADIDQVLKLIDAVGVEMDRDQQWQEQIIERPQVLGVDNFGDRGLIVRVWIKTQPLKQWDVAREYRRRLKIAFDSAGIEIPVPQQAVWLNNASSLPLPLDSKDASSLRR